MTHVVLERFSNVDECFINDVRFTRILRRFYEDILNNVQSTREPPEAKEESDEERITKGEAAESERGGERERIAGGAAAEEFVDVANVNGVRIRAVSKGEVSAEGKTRGLPRVENEKSANKELNWNCFH